MDRPGTLTVKVEGLGILDDVKDQFLFAPQGIEKATDRALNHALKAVRAEGVRIAREKYTAKARAVRARIKIHRVSIKNARGEVFFSGKVGEPAGEFDIRPRRAPNWKGVNPRERKPAAGILARFIRDGAFSAVEGPHGEKSFLAPFGGSGKIYVWYRRTSERSGARKQVADKGMRMLFGPSPIQALLSVDARDRLAEYGQDDFRKQLVNQVKQLFRKGVA